MFDFKAYFYGNDVYINEKYRYDTNEILTAYLNNSRAKKILKEDFVDRLKRFKRRLTLSPYMEYENFSRYNDNVFAAIGLLENLNRIISSLPPFNKILDRPPIKLDDILNGYDRFFEDGLDSMDYSLGRVDEDFANEYGYGEKDDMGNYYLRLNRFDLLPLDKSDLEDEDATDDLRELNRTISSYFDIYIKFLNAYLQIQQIYKPFICDYLHHQNAFLSPNKTCRDVGSKRRYDEKCKNDPVWQTYNRAYKAHYARYMKKKMTVSEFEAWSRFASEIRDRALAGEMPYNQYYADIRK